MDLLINARRFLLLVAFHLWSANAVGHIEPSSGEAVSLKPTVLNRVFIFVAPWKKQITLPFLPSVA